MNKPLVSILIPVYNTEDYLPKCLDSIVNQTYSNLQVVIIDDGSKDRSLSIAQKYAKQYPYIEVYHQENQGVASTRNNLLDKVKGDYVLFVDSDDWCELDMVEFLVDKSINFNADVTICSNVINDAPVDLSYIEYPLDKNEIIKKFLFHKELRGSLCNKLVKSSLLHNLKFRTDVSYGEDALFCWHFFLKSNIVYVTTKELYHYRMNANSICHSSFSKKKLSGHFVWQQICMETATWYPQFLNIAQARHCIEDILLLRDAAHCKYKNKKDIEMLQRTVRNTRKYLNKVDITSSRMKLYAIISSYSYWLSSKI